MSIKKRIESIEKETQNKADGVAIFDENDPTDMYIKSVCVEKGIPFSSRIVGIWRRFLIPKARDNNVIESENR